MHIKAQYTLIWWNIALPMAKSAGSSPVNVQLYKNLRVV